jgi:hypothetical protein
LSFLHAFIDVPVGSGVVISANEFILGTIYKMQGSAQEFPYEVFIAMVFTIIGTLMVTFFLNNELIPMKIENLPGI